jgi:hypothetical protein
LAIKLLKVGNTKAVKYLGGVMKKMFQKAKGRDFSLVYQGVAFFIIMADMASDEEAREGIAEIAKMINSTDDFLDILDYFSIADDEITLPPITAANAPEYGLFPQAHAGIISGTGKALGIVFKELAPILAKSGKEAPKVLGQLGRSVKKANKPHITKVAYSKVFVGGALKAARTVGIQKLRKLMSSKHRLGPITLIAIIAYLENELDDGRFLSASYLSTFDREHSVEELRKLYVKSIPAVAAGEKNYGNFVKNAHGAQFQLMQLAILHGYAVNNPVAGVNPSRVVGIEVPRMISLFKKKEDLVSAIANKKYQTTQEFLSFERNIDIMTGTIETAEIWREMKSYKSSGTGKTGNISISPWTWGQRSKPKSESNDQNITGNTAHRQYILDRVADKTFARMGDGERVNKSIDETAFNVKAKEIYWHFHDFETKSTKSPNISKIKKAFDKLPINEPKFFSQHASKYDSDVFIMGTIDLFLTNSKSILADAVRAEVADKIANVAEE